MITMMVLLLLLVVVVVVVVLISCLTYLTLLKTALCYGLVLAKGLREARVAPIRASVAAPDGANPRNHSFLFSRGADVPAYVVNDKARLRSETPDPSTLEPTYFQPRQLTLAQDGYGMPHSLNPIREVGSHQDYVVEGEEEEDDDDDDGTRKVHLPDDDDEETGAARPHDIMIFQQFSISGSLSKSEGDGSSSRRGSVDGTVLPPKRDSTEAVVTT